MATQQEPEPGPEPYDFSVPVGNEYRFFSGRLIIGEQRGTGAPALETHPSSWAPLLLQPLSFSSPTLHALPLQAPTTSRCWRPPSSSLPPQVRAAE